MASIENPISFFMMSRNPSFHGVSRQIFSINCNLFFDIDDNLAIEANLLGNSTGAVLKNTGCCIAMNRTLPGIDW